MKTKIIIKNIKVSCILGVTKEERQSAQEISISIYLYVNAAVASKTDNIHDTVNYKQVYDKVVLLVERSSYRLLESLGNAIADLCLTYAGVKKAIITVAKYNRLQKVDYVALEIEKENE